MHINFFMNQPKVSMTSFRNKPPAGVTLLIIPNNILGSEQARLVEVLSNFWSGSWKSRCANCKNKLIKQYVEKTDD